MTVKSPSAQGHGYAVASSTLTKDRPSGSWLLANNPTLAFSSFLSNGSTNRPILSTRPTPLNSSYNDIITKPAMIKPPSTHQTTRRRTTTTQKQSQSRQQPGRNISFESEFPTLTNVSSPSTDPFNYTSSSTTTPHHHAWSNTQRIQHKVKSPAKAPWNDDGKGNEDDGNMMEIERLKALVPRRHSHHQSGSGFTSSSSSSSSATGVQRRRLSSISASRVVTTIKKRPSTRPWTANDQSTTTRTTTTTTLKQDDDSSSSPSTCSSIISPPPSLSIKPTSSTHMNDVVTKRDQLRFYLFLKKWTGHLVVDGTNPNGWQQQQHDMSRPFPIGTQRYGAFTTSFYGYT